MKKIFTLWLASSFVLTVIFGTIYTVGQQVLRMDANDPQIQLVEDIAVQLNNGANAEAFTNATQIDIAKSLSPFVIIYDKSGKVLASSAELDGKTPELPRGVLNHATPQNRVTWQPNDTVRIASVIQSDNDGYVLAGRNMREVERREGNILILVGLGWGVVEIGIAGFGLYVSEKFRNKGKNTSNGKPNKTKSKK